ncbi:hypothetical protein BTM_838 [Burkholderia thailandensis 34]|uniref:hypothetical protein n=1 Tax=Burkholderia thailandensis TaxID=57975 RepID=UPI0005D7586E|nr:hypothetical protein [Burkholderia thailandensis]AJY27720.1 hypothetical protein BTM_838 [Burkholderia thailandensis 34]
MATKKTAARKVAEVTVPQATPSQKRVTRTRPTQARAVPTLDRLHDERVDCHSIITSMTTKDYLQMVDAAYSSRGGVEGQREKLRTTSAIRIRRRMVEDIVQGAVLPPVVVGVVLDAKKFATVATLGDKELRTLIRGLESERISIIDGMQRTTALREAAAMSAAVDARAMRVEFWVSDSTNSLIYRMLVLNTGQVPWNLRNQIEVVFRSLILEIKAAVPSLDVLQTADGRRRSKGGQFQANEVVELFLVFGARKEKIDIRERLADEFTRLDFMEAASDKRFTKHFCVALDNLAKLDFSFDRFKKGRASERGDSRFIGGKDLFASQPACVGLITAIATEVFGRPGISRSSDEQEKRLDRISKGVTRLVAKLSKMNSDQLEEFLGFQTLNEAISRGRTGLSVGDMEREFFLKGFQVLIEMDFKVDDLTPCWRAY